MVVEGSAYRVDPEVGYEVRLSFCDKKELMAVKLAKVLEEVEVKDLNAREIALIQHHNTICPNGYNIHQVM